MPETVTGCSHEISRYVTQRDLRTFFSSGASGKMVGDFQTERFDETQSIYIWVFHVQILTLGNTA